MNKSAGCRRLKKECERDTPTVPEPESDAKNGETSKAGTEDQVDGSSRRPTCLTRGLVHLRRTKPNDSEREDRPPMSAMLVHPTCHSAYYSTSQLPLNFALVLPLVLLHSRK